jgi:hypothetical protein
VLRGIILEYASQPDGSTHRKKLLRHRGAKYQILWKKYSPVSHKNFVTGLMPPCRILEKNDRFVVF